MGLVISIQKFSTGDGPGIRSTVFLKGCPLKCPWCSNPESQDFHPEPGYRSNLCIKCGKCINACPENAISVKDDLIHIDRSKCKRCGSCVKACPSKAMIMYGTEMTAAEVINEVKKDIKYFNKTHGGMTLSGGEPLSQIDFAEELLKLAHANGIRTCIETTGCGDLKRLIPYLDDIYMDIKAADPADHENIVGVRNEKIIKSLNDAAGSGKPFIVRIPFIPGYNTSDEQINGMAKIISDAGVKQVELMPYHEYGITKYDAINRDYVTKAHKPSAEELQHAVGIIETYSLKVMINER